MERFFMFLYNVIDFIFSTFLILSENVWGVGENEEWFRENFEFKLFECG